MIATPPRPSSSQGYYPVVSFPPWFHDEALKARLVEIGQRRYRAFDDGPDRPHAVRDAFTELVALLADPEDAALTHRRYVRLGLILALGTRFSISLYEAGNAAIPKVRKDVERWLKDCTPFPEPVGPELLPVPMTAEQVRDDAVEVHRTLSEMPGNPEAAGELLWDILDLTLDGYAIHPGGGLSKRDLFNWALSEAVPAAWLERLPDHIFNGDWPWPPRPAEDQSPSMKNT